MIQIQLLNALDTFLEAVSVVAKWQELDPQVAATEKKIGAIFKRQGQIFLRGFAGLKGQIGEAAFREALSADDWVRVFDTATGATLEAFFEVIQGAASDGLRRGATQTLADVNIDFAFNLRNPRAEQYLQEHGYGLISQIDAVTRGNIATIIDNGTAEGWSYNRMAREISSLYSQMAVGQPQQHIDSRAHLIAVTEIGNAYEAGGAIVIQDLQDAGLQMEKMWLTVGDDRVSDGCEGNAAEGWIPYTQAHASGHMNPLRFPGCRCTELYRRKPSTRPTTVAAPAAAQQQQQQLQYTALDRQLTNVLKTVDGSVNRTAMRLGIDAEEVESVVDETFRKLVTDNDIAIQFPSRHLDALLADGRFKTQFETESSGGTLNTRIRAEAEELGLGIPADVNPAERPIYGYMDLGQAARFNVHNYGDLTFIVKDEVRQRATVTADDSLQNMLDGNVAGTPMINPGKAGWDRQVPAIYAYAQSGDITDIMYSFAYIEVQMQNGVSLSDMSAVIDARGVLTAAQRQALIDRGIEVRDR